jgi:hypothetical protein
MHIEIDKSFPVLAIKANFWLLLFVIPLTAAVGVVITRSNEFTSYFGGVFAGIVTMAIPLILLLLYGFWIRSSVTKGIWLASCTIMVLLLGCANAFLPIAPISFVVVFTGVATPFLVSLIKRKNDDRADDPDVKPMGHSGL